MKTINIIVSSVDKKQNLTLEKISHRYLVIDFLFTHQFPRLCRTRTPPSNPIPTSSGTVKVESGPPVLELTCGTFMGELMVA